MFCNVSPLTPPPHSRRCCGRRCCRRRCRGRRCRCRARRCRCRRCRARHRRARFRSISGPRGRVADPEPLAQVPRRRGSGRLRVRVRRRRREEERRHAGRDGRLARALWLVRVARGLAAPALRRPRCGAGLRYGLRGGRRRGRWLARCGGRRGGRGRGRRGAAGAGALAAPLARARALAAAARAPPLLLRARLGLRRWRAPKTATAPGACRRRRGGDTAATWCRRCGART